MESVMGSSITGTCCAVRHKRCYLSLYSIKLSNLQMAKIKIGSLETSPKIFREFINKYRYIYIFF